MAFAYGALRDVSTKHVSVYILCGLITWYWILAAKAFLLLISVRAITDILLARCRGLPRLRGGAMTTDASILVSENDERLVQQLRRA
jgi:hypothetical protein